MPQEKPVVGIDLGGTNMQIGVIDETRRILGRAKKKTKAAEGMDAVIGRIIDGVHEAARAAGLEVAQLAGVGIGAPGAVQPETGTVVEAGNLAWKNVPLKDILEQRLGVPVVLDNDVNAAVYGEFRLGAAQNARDIFGVWVGTGIGGGLILDRKLFYGHYFTAGEFGHMVIFPGALPGNRTIEQNCSRTSIAERILRLADTGRDSIISRMMDPDAERLKSRAIAKAYQQDDDLVREVVDTAAELLGTAIAGVVSLLSLEMIVIGGGLTEALGDPFVERIAAAVRHHTFPDKCKAVQVVGTALLDDAGVLGAAMIATDRLQ